MRQTEATLDGRNFGARRQAPVPASGAAEGALLREAAPAAGPPPARPGRTFRLRTLLAGAFLLLPLLAAGSASLVVADRAADEVRAGTQEAAAASAAQLREQLEREMAQRWREVHGLAEALALLGPGADAEARRQRLERLRGSYPHYAWLGFASPEGIVLAATGGLLEGQRVAERPWFRAGLLRAGVQDVHRAVLLESLLPPSDEEGGRRFVDVAVPVRDEEGAVTGVLGAHVSWAFARELERSVLRAAAPRRPELLVLSAREEVLQRPDRAAGGTADAWASGDAALDAALDATSRRWMEARSAPQPAPSSGEASAQASSLGWTVLARLDEDAALAPVRAMRRDIVGCGAGAGLAFALIGWLLARRIARPMEELRLAAEAVGRGERASLPAAGGYAEARALSGALGALMARRDAAEAGLRSLAGDLARQVCERAAETVRTAEELRRNVAYLQALFQHAPFGLLVMTALPDGGFRYDSANHAALRLAGFDAAEVTGREPHDVLPRDQADALLHELRRCAASGAAHAYDMAHDVPAGRRHQHVTLVPVQEAGGAVGRVLVCVEDVTDRTRMEAELREAHRLDAVGRLAAGVAHDFNNLLQALMGNLELLGAHVAGDRWADAYVAAALQSAERGARLTHQMLSFSRKQFLRARPLAADAVLAGAGRLAGAVLGDGVELRTEIPPGLPPLLADPGQLEAAILNIALNARDAMPEGGRVVLSAAVAEADGSVAAPGRAGTGEGEAGPWGGVLRGLPAGRYVVLAMADTGSGMDDATAAHAFEPFFTTKGVGKGSGLGLSMVQGFARQSGGDAVIRSAPGKGTVVELWLPAAVRDAEEPAVPEEAPDPAPAPFGAPRLLLVGRTAGGAGNADLDNHEPGGMAAQVMEPMEAVAAASPRLRGAAWLRT